MLNKTILYFIRVHGYIYMTTTITMLSEHFKISTTHNEPTMIIHERSTLWNTELIHFM